MTTVADLYTQVLGRAPDAGGLAYWESMFGNTVDPAELATFKSVAQVTEPERVATVAAAATPAPAVVDNTPTAVSAPTGLLGTILNKLDTTKVGTPQQLEFTPAQTINLGGDTPYVISGPQVKTPNVVAQTSGGGGDGGDAQITGYLSQTPTTVNGVSVYAHYDPSGKLDYYAAPEATWLDNNTTARGMWNPDGTPRPNVQKSGGGAFSEITSGFDDLILQNPAYRAAALSYALGPTQAGTSGASADASFVAADAAQLAQQGLSQAAIEQNLIAAGVDSFIAADAAQLALQGIKGTQLEGLLTQSSGGNPLFIPNASGVPTGGTPNTNTPTTGTPTGTGAGTGLSTGTLTPTDLTNILKAGVGLTGLLGGTKAIGGLVGGGTNLTLPAQNRAGISSGSAQYSPEYYQAIQAKYNQMMSPQPRDVTTELKNWYETKYAPTATITPTKVI